MIDGKINSATEPFDRFSAGCIFVKAACRKTALAVCAADGDPRVSAPCDALLLRTLRCSDLQTAEEFSLQKSRANRPVLRS